ncbi:MAG: glycosyltransferase [Bacteroidetes bacterium]|nr:glycosyltransferase [Bacteroidota bacterium]
MNIFINKNNLISNILTSENINHDDIFINQIKNFNIVERIEFIKDYCRSKNVIHFGFLDSPFLESKFDSSKILHTELKNITNGLYGVDINEIDLKKYRNLTNDNNNCLLDISNPYVDLRNLMEVDCDVILFAEVLEHIPNPGEALKNLHEICLHKSAKLIVSVPNAYNFDFFMTANESIEIVHPDHFFYFSPVTIRKLLTKYGFIVEQLNMYTPGGNKNYPGITQWGIICVCKTNQELIKNKPVNNQEITIGTGLPEMTILYNNKTKEQKPVNAKAFSDTKLKILMTVEFYYPHIGGAETVVQKIAEGLQKYGHTVTVATSKLEERDFTEFNAVNIEEFNISGNYVRGIKGNDVDRYTNFLLTNQFDVMFNYAAQQWATDIAFSTIKKTKHRRVNIIAPCGYSALNDAKTLKDNSYLNYFSKIIPSIIPEYDAAVYHSVNYQDYEFANINRFTNSLVISNGASEEEFLSSPKINFREKYNINSKFLLLCVANFYPGKGQEKIINSLNFINRRDFEIVFIGKEGSTLDKLRSISSKLPVKFLVNIPREDTVAAFFESDLFVFASDFEVFPIVILEAMASKTPYVSTDCGNLKELRGGVISQPNQIFEVVNELLDDEGRRNKLAEEGWNDWKKNYTWSAVVSKYEKLFQHLYIAKVRGLK